MAANTLSEVIKSIEPGEDGDQAYRRLYAHQVKPCDFRRWFAVIKRGDTCLEIDEAAANVMGELVTEGISVEEAFLEYCPGFVGPGEFSVAFNCERKRLMAATPAPSIVVTSEPVEAVEVS